MFRPHATKPSTTAATVLTGVVELAPSGRGPAGRVDLALGGSGITIAPTGDRWTAVPTLVTWSHLQGFSADRSAGAVDGATGQVLEIVSHGPTYPGGVRTRRFVVPAPELVSFFRTLGDLSAQWAHDLEASDAGPGAMATVGGWLSAGRATAEGMAAAVAASVTARLVAWGVWSRHPRHGQGRRRLGPIAAGLLVVALVAGGATASLAPGGAASGTPRHAAGARMPGFSGNIFQATAAPQTPNLPAAISAPAPAPPNLAGSAPLQSHEIFGYAPYWTLPESSGFNVADLTTLAYFSVDANGNGTLDQSGSGWNGYESQDLANLVTRSHAAGARVVLTVTCFSQSALDQITSDPNAPATLSAALIAAVSAKNLDGVNFDFEGQGSADRNGLTALLTQVSNALHAANPHWQVTMATYASAAADSAGFYDVAALAPALDGFFVMAYDMNDPVTPSPTAPLVGGGYNDTEALQQFTAVMPASKVILGVPYYGYDWPTTNGTQGAQSTGGETPLSYGTIAAAGNPTYWDDATQTAWTSYQVGGQWHETYFDNPTSLALKAQLANAFHIRGLGIWALGMDGNDPAMLAALLGNAPPVKDLSTGPTATSSSPTTTTAAGLPGTGYTTTGIWQGQTVPLTPVASVLTGGTFVGTLGGLLSTAPQLACLQSGPPLDVWALPGSPGIYEVLAVQPGDCITAAFDFPIPAGTGSSPPTTSTTVPPTTSTTSVPPTTTTTATVPPTTSTSTSPAGHTGAGGSTPSASLGGRAGG